MIKSPRPRSPRWISTSIPQTEWGSTLALYSSAEYHVNNLVSPVLFQEGLSLIPDNAVVVEIAPHALLQVSDKDCNEFLSPTGDKFFFFFEQHSNWITLTSSPGHSEAQPQAHLFHFALVEERTCQQLGVLSFSHRQDLHEWVSTDLVILQNIIKAIIVSYIFFSCLFCSINIDSKQLYPAVKYPVPVGTPLISPLIQWDHSQSWDVPKVEDFPAGSGGSTSATVYNIGEYNINI